MKTVYTKLFCRESDGLKEQLRKDRVPFKNITVFDEGEPRPLGASIARWEFLDKYPGVELPFVSEATQ